MVVLYLLLRVHCFYLSHMCGSPIPGRGATIERGQGHGDGDVAGDVVAVGVAVGAGLTAGGEGEMERWRERVCVSPTSGAGRHR